jgi:hypothetical protein
MKRAAIRLIGLYLLVLVLAAGCETPPAPVVEVPKEPPPPLFVSGRQVTQQYLAGTLADYELVWKLYDLKPWERPVFLDGFVKEFSQAGRPTIGVEYRRLLEEAISGTQFRTACELGSKHASRAVTNQQVQGVIRSSLGVPQGVSLGWKAGYIRGFAAWWVSELARTGTVNEKLIRRLHRESATTYYALRATVGP